MAQALTDEKIGRFREAFARWDTAQAGTIVAADMADVLRSLGETPSEFVELMCQLFRDGQPERMTFTEFLNIVEGNPCTIPSIDEEFLELVAKTDDGSGFICFRNLMRSLHWYLDDCGCNLPDSELRSIYEQILDVRLFEFAGGLPDPEVMWASFEDEYRCLPRKVSVDLQYGNVGSRTAVDATCKPTHRHQMECVRQEGDQTSQINLTVVDVAGKPVLSDAFPPSRTLEELQEIVEETLGLSKGQYMMIHMGHGPLSQWSILSDEGVTDDSTLMLVRKMELKVDYAKFLRQFMQSFLESIL